MRPLLLTLLGFFIGYLVFNRGCSAISPITKYDTVYKKSDTVVINKQTTRYKKGDDIYHERIVVDSVFINQPFDTAMVLANYLSVNVYKDTVQLVDSLGFLSIVDTITQNKLIGRQVDARVKEKVITNTISLREKPRNSIFLGLDYVLMQKPQISASYGGKNRVYYRVGYGGGLTIGVAYKIK